MPNEIIQPSFAAGELAPSLYARVDLDKYRTGMALLRNWLVDYHGGIRTRPGTRYCVTAEPSAVRLIPFIVSATTSYVLEVGNGYIRVLYNGAYVLNGATALRIITPYAWTDVPLLKYEQSADVLTITHPNYPSATLTRTGPSAFTYAAEARTTRPAPTGLDVEPTGANAENSSNTATGYIYGYVVTAVYRDTGEESPASSIAVVNNAVLDGMTHENVLTWNIPTSSPVSYCNIYKWGPVNAANPPATLFGYIGRSESGQFTDTNFAPDFSKTPPEFSDPFSPGQIAAINIIQSGGNGGGYYTGLVITDPTGTGAQAIGVASSPTGGMTGVIITAPGMNYSNPTITSAGNNTTFTSTLGQLSGTYPGVVSYIQQRRVYGGSDASPQSLVFSQTGAYNNFDTSPVSEDTDAITITLAGRQVDQIKSLVPTANGLIAFTAGGAWLISGGSPQAAITPSTISALPQGSSGASDLRPILIGINVLYIQNRGNVVRDLSFNFYTQNYSGVDRSILSNHLFKSYTTLDWAWSEEPYRTLWAARNDGALLCMSYVPEQEVYAWSQHFIAGATVMSVCAIPEGQQNSVYILTQRYIAGVANYVIETLVFTDPQVPTDVWAVDAGLSYSGAPVSKVNGLNHLVGQAVVARIDGTLVTGLTVASDGSLALPVAGQYIVAGLGYTCDAQTLAVADEQTQGKRKSVVALTLRLLNSQGLLAGPTESTLTELKLQQPPIVVPNALFTGDQRLVMTSAFTEGGQVWIQAEPGCPATVLGIIPEIRMGDVRG